MKSDGVGMEMEAIMESDGVGMMREAFSSYILIRRELNYAALGYYIQKIRKKFGKTVH